VAQALEFAEELECSTATTRYYGDANRGRGSTISAERRISLASHGILPHFSISTNNCVSTILA
jgi:hypothetical protein